MKLRSIRSKLILVFLLGGLVPVISVGFLSINTARSGLRKEIEVGLLRLAEAKEGQVYAYLDGIEARTIDFSSDGFIKDSLKEIVDTGSDQAVEVLNRHLINNKKPLDETLVGILIMNLDGKVVASTNSEEIGEDESNDDYFVGGKKGIFTTELRGHGHFDLERPFIVSAPLADKETGKLLGVLANVFSEKKLNDILSGKFQMDKGAFSGRLGEAESLEVYLVNRERVMFLPPDSLGGTGPADHLIGTEVATLPVQKCLENKEEIVDVYLNYAGREVIGASMCIPARGWVLLSEISIDEALLPLDQIFSQLVLVTLVSALFVIVTMLIISNAISRPIRKLHEGTEIIAQGNLDYRVDIKTKDEVEQLGRAFNEMAAKLSQSYSGLEEQVKERTRELAKKISELERLNKLMVGRELKMKELKKEIEELKTRPKQD